MKNPEVRVLCPGCNRHYSVQPAAVPDGGLIRCDHCGAEFLALPELSRLVVEAPDPESA